MLSSRWGGGWGRPWLCDASTAGSGVDTGSLSGAWRWAPKQALPILPVLKSGTHRTILQVHRF